MDILQLTPDLQISHIGPDLKEGRLPAVFYFAISARDSLELDPFNQPALYLAKKGVRVFSLDLPAHEQGQSALDAIGVWAKEFSEGNDLLTPFFERAHYAVELLFKKGLLVREKIGLMGLSRGGLITSHLALLMDQCRAIVNFAPLTKLTMAKEFSESGQIPNAEKLNLENHVQALSSQTMRWYIGNRDVRVGTNHCCDLILKMADIAYEQGEHTPPIELVVTPSIGQMGHGTSKEAFEAGAHWIGKKLGAIR